MGTHTVWMTATDAQGGSCGRFFEITVLEFNADAQELDLDEPIDDQTATEDAAFILSVPESAFSSAERTDWLTYTAVGVSEDGSAEDLPAWLAFDGATRTFSGTPANADVGVYTLRIRGSDCSSVSHVGEFTVTVENVNDEPVVEEPEPDPGTPEDTPPEPALSNQFAEIFDTFEFQVPEGTFSDADADEELTLSAAGYEDGPWPTWLQFDSASGLFTSVDLVPEHELNNMYVIELTATDGDGATASTEFSITVVDSNVPPEELNHMSNLQATEDVLPGEEDYFSYTVPTEGDSAIFTDPDFESQPLNVGL